MRLGNVSDAFYGFVLAHSLQSVSFPRPFSSFSKVSLKVVAQLYGEKATCSQCPHNPNCSFTDSASSPASVQRCRSGSLGHLPLWCLLPLCTSEQGVPGFLTSPEGIVTASINVSFLKGLRGLLVPVMAHAPAREVEPWGQLTL